MARALIALLQMHRDRAATRLLVTLAIELPGKRLFADSTFEGTFRSTALGAASRLNTAGSASTPRR